MDLIPPRTAARSRSVEHSRPVPSSVSRADGAETRKITVNPAGSWGGGCQSELASVIVVLGGVAVDLFHRSVGNRRLAVG
jgi:hypothetical protein